MKPHGRVLGSLWLMAVLLMAACNDGSPLQPRSSGRPYEVLLVDDRDSTVFRMLDRDVPGLPQPEPMFDITSVAMERYQQAEQLARAIVVVEVDATQYTQPALRYEKNTNARPQLIVHLRTPSMELVGKQEKRLGAILCELLNRFETDAAVAAMKKASQPKAEQLVSEQFGLKVSIPADLTSMKQGKDFLWLSNNAPTGMENLCVYRLPVRIGEGSGSPSQQVDGAGSLPPSLLIAGRDSIMRQNIPGEREGMYMQTAAATVTVENNTLRGLWEMKNDAMGGPFVLSYLPVGDSVLVVEAFVYAPESKKRNLVRRLEAILPTVELKRSLKP